VECSLPPKPGLDNHMMIDAIHEGKLKAMYLFGEEMSLVDSNANFVGDALSKLDFFVVQEIFFSETCQFADVILPASPSLEKEGTFTSTERRIQRLYQVLSLWGKAVPTGSLSRTSPIGWAQAGSTSILLRFTKRSPTYAVDGRRHVRAPGRL
jgi:formate dehydrogenase major subunit